MIRTLENVLRVKGPFLGVNEKATTEILPPEYAESMLNVLVHRGMIEVRPGAERILSFAPGNNAFYRVAHIQPIPTRIDGGDVEGDVLVVGSSNSESSHIFVNNRNVAPGDPELYDLGAFATIAHGSRGAVVPHLRAIYVVFGAAGKVGVVYTGTRQATYGPPMDAGIAPPASVEVGSVSNADVPSPFSSGLQFPLGVYEFACSFYDSETGTESNAQMATISGLPESTVLTFDLADRALRIDVTPPAAFANARVKQVRVYAKITTLQADVDGVESGAEEAFRLVGQYDFETRNDISVPPPTPTANTYYLGEDGMRVLPFAEPLSIRGTGPYAPTRNGIPPLSNTAIVFSDRVLYASATDDNPGAIYYSDRESGEHVAADDFILFPDSGTDLISGWALFQGRLIVFKSSAIYVLTGTIARQSNDKAALGELAPAGNYQLFKTTSTIGCFNTEGGVGVVECDDLLYYNAKDGIYTFNGLVSRKISDPVQATFAGYTDAQKRKCSMANDRVSGLLWICFDSNVPVLCYDYRRGLGDPSVNAWTLHDFGGTDIFADAPQTPCPAVAPSAAFLTGSLDDIDSAKGVEQVRASLTRDADNRIVPWHYRTPWMDLDLPDREKRIHYVTLFYGAGNEQGKYFRFSVRVEPADSDAGAFQGRARDSVVFASISAGLQASRVFPVGLRGTRVQLELSADLTREGRGPFTGFAIDAEPVGWR